MAVRKMNHVLESCRDGQQEQLTQWIRLSKNVYLELEVK